MPARAEGAPVYTSSAIGTTRPANEEAAMGTDDTASAQWHQRTLDRSLKSARARAISQGDRLIAAAADLLRETGRPEFTVQEVVDRAGMSLRSFYHHFATKDDLLLALIEETIRSYIRRLTPVLEGETDPIEQLHLFVKHVYGGEGSDDPAARGMVLFHWQLAEARTEEFVASLAPQTRLLQSLLERGVEAGQVRDDLSPAVLTAFITHSMMSLLDLRVMGISFTDAAMTGDDVWQCVLGLVSPR
jgi:AcrR family transcriptional regulator